MPNIRMRIVDDNDQDVALGETGEFLLSGLTVTKGYVNNPEATREAFLGGWYRTGDVGLCKDGRVSIVDWKKELVKYKGMQVAPAELGGFLISHPKILDAAVIGIHSEVWETEVPRAYVVAKPDDAPSASEIAEFMKMNLAIHKQLRGGVELVDVIPKSPSGKILRKDLRSRSPAGRKYKL